MPSEFLKRYGRQMKAAAGCGFTPEPSPQNRYPQPSPRGRKREPSRDPVRIGELLDGFVEDVVRHPFRNELLRRMCSEE